MNIPVLVVACITLIAVIAHVIVGTKETAAIEPATDENKQTVHWLQAMCAFQMLSIDLLAVAVALFAVVFMDFGAIEPQIILMLSLLFFLWGAVWILQILWLKKPANVFFQLPHWMVWFACSGLLYYGS